MGKVHPSHPRGQVNLGRTLRENLVQVNIIAAATGHVVHHHRSTGALGLLRGRWSQFGDICLVVGLHVVLVLCPCSNTFNLLELQGDGSGCLQDELVCQYEGDQYLQALLMSLSPCGRIVIARRNQLVPGGCCSLQHWQLPPASASTTAACSAPAAGVLKPTSVAELVDPALYFWAQAWHPVRSARMYAMPNKKGGVHLISATANRCIKSWTADEFVPLFHTLAGLPSLP